MSPYSPPRLRFFVRLASSYLTPFAFGHQPLPLPFDSAPTVAHQDTIHFRLFFDHWTPLSHMMPHGLSPVALDFNLFLSFPQSLLLCIAYTVVPSSQTCQINTPAQPWQKPGNCSPLSLPLLSVSDFLRIFTTSIRPPVMLRHPTCTSAPSSKILDRFRHRAVLSCQLIPTTNARLHLAPCPYLSTGLHSWLSWEHGSYFPYLRTLTQTSRLRYIWLPQRGSELF